MREPRDPDFYQILAAWWASINLRQTLTGQLLPGSPSPARDWREQTLDEVIWYYPVSSFTGDQLQAFLELVYITRDYSSIQAITALALTVGVDQDIAHCQEIPGIWLIRVVKDTISTQIN